MIPALLEDADAPVTLRSPPSTLRVRDRVTEVELALVPEPAWRASSRARFESIDDEAEPPTRHWPRVA